MSDYDYYYDNKLKILEEYIKERYTYKPKLITDEEILEKMDIKVIETFIKRKKLEKLKKEK